MRKIPWITIFFLKVSLDSAQVACFTTLKVPKSLFSSEKISFLENGTRRKHSGKEIPMFLSGRPIN